MANALAALDRQELHFRYGQKNLMLKKEKLKVFTGQSSAALPPMQLLVHTIYLHLQQKNITALGLIPATTR